jgi:hypothetical protein
MPKVRRRGEGLASAVGVEPTPATFVASSPNSLGPRRCLVVLDGLAPSPRAL